MLDGSLYSISWEMELIISNYFSKKKLFVMIMILGQTWEEKCILKYNFIKNLTILTHSKLIKF